MESREDEKHVEYLKESIEQAKSEAPFAKDLEASKDRHDKSMADFIAGKISRKEFEDQEMAGSIEFESENDFRLVLSIIGFNDATIEELISHEIEHANEARNYGLTPTFMIQFFRGENEKLSLYPSVKLPLPENMTDEQVREALRKTIQATNDLSPRDQDQLEND